MVTALRRARMSQPEFRDRISTFTVIFPNHTLLADDVVEWINTRGEHGLNESQCVALATLRSSRLLDNRSYRRATGVDSQVARSERQDEVHLGAHAPSETATHRSSTLSSSTGSAGIQPGRVSTPVVPTRVASGYSSAARFPSTARWLLSSRRTGATRVGCVRRRRSGRSPLPPAHRLDDRALSAKVV